MTEITLEQGDITNLPVDAIVNAANEQLLLGSGVAGAIRTKGGAGIQQQCNRLAPVATGETAVTDAGNLPQKWIIHAVAPRVSMENWRELLAKAVRNIYRAAETRKIVSLGVPALGTGVFGLPVAEAARIMIQTAQEMGKTATHPQKLVFCLFGEEAYEVFRAALHEGQHD